ncbi:hypothetical protein LEP3755_67140 (plasmid) [Leptolyngbya sp. NIES-3755]|nr:hypothetical protein LEP3755_67140 [Leptolyngbya sp. NIES-3755]
MNESSPRIRAVHALKYRDFTSSAASADSYRFESDRCDGVLGNTLTIVANPHPSAKAPDTLPALVDRVDGLSL